MTDHTRRPAPMPHPAYERLATADQHSQHDQQHGQQHGRWSEPRPAPGRYGPPGVLPRRGDPCPSCDATRACCQCRADVGDLRRFARRMAELHQHTGTPLCGCGAHHCYVRRRLDDIGPENTR